jgi:SagB-type dehydrogenase family enzyme
MARLRASRCLVFLFDHERLIGFNFLTKQAFCCTPPILGLLQKLGDWTEKPNASAFLPGRSPDGAAKLIEDLIDLSAVIEEGTATARREQQFKCSWEWGLGTSLLHFSLQDAGSYMPLEEAERWRKERAVHDPSPPLYRHHGRAADTIKLERSSDPLLALFAKRRTNRTPLPHAIPLPALAGCLEAGLAITGFVDTETGRLPLSMTPSGGARNPFEAYVYARNVEGLDCGFYHYSAAEHSLLPLTCQDRPSPSYLLGDQDWAEAMPCIIFLVAHFERTMWKYRDDNGYRVVLIEAGHIGQNIMVTATAKNITACPTALFRHGEIHGCLGIKNVTQSVLYALTLSYPDKASKDCIS